MRLQRGLGGGVVSPSPDGVPGVGGGAAAPDELWPALRQAEVGHGDQVAVQLGVPAV